LGQPNCIVSLIGPLKRNADERFFYIKMAHAEREQKGLKMELYNTCARLIERGKTNGMQRKLDIFFANDRLTEEEYEKLCTQLAEKLKEQGNA